MLSLPVDFTAATSATCQASYQQENHSDVQYIKMTYPTKIGSEIQFSESDFSASE